MMKKYLPYGLIIASVLLIIYNLIYSGYEIMSSRSLVNNLSSILLIIAMVITVRNNNKKSE